MKGLSGNNEKKRVVKGYSAYNKIYAKSLFVNFYHHSFGRRIFCGLEGIRPDMQMTANSYFSGQNLADIRLLSTLGFSQEDIEEIERVDGVAAVMPAYFTDAFYDGEGSQYTMRIHSLDIGKSETDLTYMNRPVLVDGRRPEKAANVLLKAA